MPTPLPLHPANPRLRKPVRALRPRALQTICTIAAMAADDVMRDTPVSVDGHKVLTVRIDKFRPATEPGDIGNDRIQANGWTGLAEVSRYSNTGAVTDVTGVTTQWAA
jgi:hypothetical protein